MSSKGESGLKMSSQERASSMLQFQGALVPRDNNIGLAASASAGHPFGHHNNNVTNTLLKHQHHNPKRHCPSLQDSTTPRPALLVDKNRVVALRKVAGVLYINELKDVILFDIPSSLSGPPDGTRLSLSGPETPYELPEPRNTDGNATRDDRADQLHDRIRQALDDIKHNHYGRYLHDRIMEGKPVSGIDNDNIQSPDFDPYLGNLQAISAFGSVATESLDLAEDKEHPLLSCADVYGQIITNSSLQWTTMNIQLSTPATFLVPPNSSFLFSKFESSLDTFNSYARSYPMPGFDFVLLDPPWENRSVKRGRRGRASHAYKTALRQEALYSLDLRPISSGGLLRRNGIVGIWITNKMAIRKFVVAKLFAYWGLELMAEWTWAKITTGGELMFDLGSRHRKPYELLLLARATQEHYALQVEDKQIFAVPEKHSRKPCIKVLIECHLRAQPRCCEIFARNLTEGWFSWGDEVLKGNSKDCWIINDTQPAEDVDMVMT